MKNIVVLCPNRIGAVADITQALAADGINIDSFEVAGPVSEGIMTLQVDQYDKALQTLSNTGFQAYSEEAVMVRIEDEPGALAKVASKLKDAQININSLRIVQRGENYAIAAVAVDDQSALRAVLGNDLVSIHL